jgi:hypothetical protein
VGGVQNLAMARASFLTVSGSAVKDIIFLAKVWDALNVVKDLDYLGCHCVKYLHIRKKLAGYTSYTVPNPPDPIWRRQRKSGQSSVVHARDWAILKVMRMGRYVNSARVGDNGDMIAY